MLSNGLDIWLFIVSLIIFILSLGITVALHSESYYWEDASLGDKIARVLRISVVVVSAIVAIYAITCGFINNRTKANEEFTNKIETKYGITLTESQIKSLTSLENQYDESEYDFAPYGETTIDGKKVLLIMKDQQPYLVTLINGEMKELPKQ